MLTVRFHLYEILEKAKLKGQKTDQWLPEPGSRMSGPTAEEHAGTFWRDGCILCLHGRMTTWLCKLVKIHRTVYPKRANFFLCKFCLNKSNFWKRGERIFKTAIVVESFAPRLSTPQVSITTSHTPFLLGPPVLALLSPPQADWAKLSVYS